MLLIQLRKEDVDHVRAAVAAWPEPGNGAPKMLGHTLIIPDIRLVGAMRTLGKVIDGK